MALFDYQAANSSGKLVSGSLEASDESSLIDRLQEMGYYPVKVWEGKEGHADGFGAAGIGRYFSKKVPSSCVAVFTQELHSLLDAGLALDNALALLADLEENLVFKGVIKELYKGIHGGKSLAECLEQFPDIFDTVYISMIRAGEAAGALDAVLERLKKFLEDSLRLREEIKSALVYPLFLTLAGGSAVIVMLFFVVPKFSGIFEDMGAALPLPTRILLVASGAMGRYWWVMAVFAAAAAAGLRHYVKTEKGKRSFDAFKCRLPLIGSVNHKSAVSRFSRTLGVLLQSGLPIVEALRISAGTMGNVVLEESIIPVVEGVRNGRGIAAPLKETGRFSAIAVHMLTVGEETGKLDEMLLKLADKYDLEIRTSAKRLITLLEPGLILVMAVIVGFIVISLLMAIFSLNEMPL